MKINRKMIGFILIAAGLLGVATSWDNFLGNTSLIAIGSGYYVKIQDLALIVLGAILVLMG